MDELNVGWEKKREVKSGFKVGELQCPRLNDMTGKWMTPQMQHVKRSGKAAEDTEGQYGTERRTVLEEGELCPACSRPSLKVCWVQRDTVTDIKTKLYKRHHLEGKYNFISQEKRQRQKENEPNHSRLRSKNSEILSALNLQLAPWLVTELLFSFPRAKQFLF